MLYLREKLLEKRSLAVAHKILPTVLAFAAGVAAGIIIKDHISFSIKDLKDLVDDEFNDDDTEEHDFYHHEDYQADEL